MKQFIVFCSLILALCAGGVEYKFELKSNKPSVIKAGETVTFSARLLSREDKKKPFTVVKNAQVLCRLVIDGVSRTPKNAVLGEKPFTISAKRTTPGWIYAQFDLQKIAGKEVKIKNRAGRLTRVNGGIGVLVEPDKLKVGKEEPKDFDAFWKSRRAMLNKVPMKAKITEVPGKAPRGFKLYDVQIPCAGGMPVSGYMTIPVNAKPKSLGAIVSYQGAGVSSSWVGARRGAIHMNINAHGIVNGKEKAFYQNLGKTTLRGYYRCGMNDREKIYFHGMYLRVMRSLDYIKSRPEWNGKVLIVTGSSQGGGQAIAAAALDPQVTLCVAAVAALSDHSGSFAQRQPGWPQFYNVRGRRKVDPKVIAATAYYDNVFFARRIKCETWLTTGLWDRTCSPAGVHVVFNNLAAKKKYLDIVPTGSHGGAPTVKGNARISAVLAGK